MLRSGLSYKNSSENEDEADIFPDANRPKYEKTSKNYDSLDSLIKRNGRVFSREPTFDVFFSPIEDTK